MGWFGSILLNAQFGRGLQFGNQPKLVNSQFNPMRTDRPEIHSEGDLREVIKSYCFKLDNHYSWCALQLSVSNSLVNIFEAKKKLNKTENKKEQTRKEKQKKVREDMIDQF